jgi:glycosyltransferase involved in cell wall biosynthesis
MNPQSEGEWRGVPFRYAPGTSIRSDRFLTRRWQDLRGIVGAVASVLASRRTREVDCIYLWMDHSRWIPFRLLRGVCWLLGMPVVCELCEPVRETWEGVPLSDGSGRRHSLLTHIDGFVAISTAMEEWVRTRKGGSRPRIVYVPILVDTDEVKPSFEPAAGGVVGYTSAPGYLDEIEFVLDVLQAARESRPDVCVRFVGWEISQLACPDLQNRVRAHVAAGSVFVAGVLPHERLVASYSECAALLLPIRDHPRFVVASPTKLGEYLASGRPVVATNLGEPGVLLSDEESAFLAEPGSVRSFTDALLRALRDSDHAATVGREGRLVAERVLDYRQAAEPLREFFSAVCDKRS